MYFPFEILLFLMINAETNRCREPSDLLGYWYRYVRTGTGTYELFHRERFEELFHIRVGFNCCHLNQKTIALQNCDLG
jgi:hypothetical protein